eukprot:scaffold33142_cov101-Isochrysis_galbana.AAC.1
MRLTIAWGAPSAGVAKRILLWMELFHSIFVRIGAWLPSGGQSQALRASSNLLAPREGRAQRARRERVYRHKALRARRSIARPGDLDLMSRAGRPLRHICSRARAGARAGVASGVRPVALAPARARRLARRQCLGSGWLQRWAPLHSPCAQTPRLRTTHSDTSRHSPNPRRMPRLPPFARTANQTPTARGDRSASACRCHAPLLRVGQGQPLGPVRGERLLQGLDAHKPRRAVALEQLKRALDLPGWGGVRVAGAKASALHVAAALRGEARAPRPGRRRLRQAELRLAEARAEVAPWAQRRPTVPAAPRAGRGGTAHLCRRVGGADLARHDRHKLCADKRGGTRVDAKCTPLIHARRRGLAARRGWRGLARPGAAPSKSTSPLPSWSISSTIAASSACTRAGGRAVARAPAHPVGPEPEGFHQLHHLALVDGAALVQVDQVENLAELAQLGVRQVWVLARRGGSAGHA